MNDPIAITIGNFDGIHKGHEYLLKSCKKIMSKYNIKKLKLITFTHNTKSYINNINHNLITPYPYNIQQLNKNNNIDIIIIHFPHIQYYSPHEFIKKYILCYSNIKAIILGEDFHFGYKGLGDIATISNYLKKLNIQCNYHSINHFYINKIKCSSSYIRHLIKNGNMTEVKTFLGRNYKINGIIVHGKKVGRTIGFPTANINIIDDYIYPKKGVYITKVSIQNKEHLALANLGHKPTITNSAPLTLEIHILNFNKDIYNQEVKIEFIKFIRDEKNFSSIKELKNQIKQDILIAQKFNNFSLK